MLITSLDLIDNPEAESYRFGTLNNGRTLVDWRALPNNNDFCVVLAYSAGAYTPWVTWILGDSGFCSGGNYFATLPEAANDLINR